MNVLYLSCHSVLEYDEIKLLHEIGLNVFSHGAYHNPQKNGDPKRPALDIPFNPELFNLSVAYGKENLHPDMIKWADVIICMHVVDWLDRNWSKFKGKRVIWRSIGQSTLNVENMIRPLRAQGLEIIRYSPTERTIPGYAGEDTMIRFYKDPEEYKNWTGEKEAILNVTQSAKDRDDFCNWSLMRAVGAQLPFHIYGSPSKQPDELWHGELSYPDLLKAFRDYRVYFYTGTYPASYTLNFIEAFMTGTPIVALGPFLGNSPHEQGQRTYEVPEIIINGVNGYCLDDINDLRTTCDILLKDKARAKTISEAGRRTAIEFFGKEKIKKQWKEYIYDRKTSF